MPAPPSSVVKAANDRAIAAAKAAASGARSSTTMAAASVKAAPSRVTDSRSTPSSGSAGSMTGSRSNASNQPRPSTTFSDKIGNNPAPVSRAVPTNNNWNNGIRNTVNAAMADAVRKTTASRAPLGDTSGTGKGGFNPPGGFVDQLSRVISKPTVNVDGSNGQPQSLPPDRPMPSGPVTKPTFTPNMTPYDRLQAMMQTTSMRVNPTEALRPSLSTIVSGGPQEQADFNKMNLRQLNSALVPGDNTSNLTSYAFNQYLPHSVQPQPKAVAQTLAPDRPMPSGPIAPDIRDLLKAVPPVPTNVPKSQGYAEAMAWKNPRAGDGTQFYKPVVGETTDQVVARTLAPIMPKSKAMDPYVRSAMAFEAPGQGDGTYANTPQISRANAPVPNQPYQPGDISKTWINPPRMGPETRPDPNVIVTPANGETNPWSVHYNPKAQIDAMLNLANRAKAASAAKAAETVSTVPKIVTALPNAALKGAKGLDNLVTPKLEAFNQLVGGSPYNDLYGRPGQGGVPGGGGNGGNNNNNNNTNKPPTTQPPVTDLGTTVPPPVPNPPVWNQPQFGPTATASMETAPPQVVSTLTPIMEAIRQRLFG